MTFFDNNEFNTYYGKQVSLSPSMITQASEMIYAQIGLRYRGNWDKDNVPSEIKRASMEQCRFMYEYEIPDIDFKENVKVGEMSANLSSHYSTYAMTILGNAGYLNRGVPLNQNMNIEMPF